MTRSFEGFTNAVHDVLELQRLRHSGFTSESHTKALYDGIERSLVQYVRDMKQQAIIHKAGHKRGLYQ